MGTVLAYLFLLLVLAPPLGIWMHRVYTRESIGRAEALVYRLCAIRPEVEQSWRRYAAAVLWFSLLNFGLLYGILRFQDRLGLNPQELAAVDSLLAFNTAASFVTNTNWQAYAGETTMSYLSAMVGLTFQCFASAAVGMAVMAAFARGFSRSGSATIGNFWRDLVRGVLYILLPLSTLVAVLLVSQGVVQTLEGPVQVQADREFEQTIVRGPAASQVAIKQLGTNGGGYFAVNSAHPLENPTPASNLIQSLLILLIPAGLTITFGLMVGQPRQGWTIMAAMTVLLVAGIAITVQGERQATSAMRAAGLAVSTANLEGKEVRFGTDSSALWATAATASSYGGVNSMHASFSSAGTAVQIANMNMGVFGAVGGGVYSMVFFVVVAALVGSLMVGRSPQYLGKRLGAREIKLAMIGILVSFAITLGLTAAATVTPSGLEARHSSGAQGFSEILYAFSSQANNNGSAMAGLDGEAPLYSVGGGLAMLFGRFVPLLAALAMAGGLAASQARAGAEGTLRTDTPQFAGLLVGVVLVLSIPLPALTLGPVVVGLGGIAP